MLDHNSVITDKEIGIKKKRKKSTIPIFFQQHHVRTNALIVV